MTTTAMLPKQGRSVMLRAESFDPAENTVDLVWTTGAAVQRYSYRDGTYYNEVLDVTPKAVRLDRLNAGAPFLNTHSDYDLSDVLGSVVPGTARIANGQGTATIKLSAAAADADTIAKIKDGIIRNVSVGYIIHEVVKTEVGDGSIPTWRVTDWEPLEISAVPIPADAGAQIRSGEAAQGGPDLHPCVVRGAETATPEPAAVETTVVAAAPAADSVLAFREAEKARVQALRATAAKLGTPADVLAQHLDDGTAADEFRALAIDLVATRTEPTPTATPAGQPAQNGDAAVADPVIEPAVVGGAASDARAAVASLSAAVVDPQVIRAQERARASEIRATGRKLGLSAEFVDGHVDAGTDLDAFRGFAIDEAAKRQAPASFAPNVGASDQSHRTYASSKREKQKGEDATRLLIALAAARGSRRDAADLASHRWGPEGDVIARALGTGVGSGGGFLVPPEMSAEVIELLRPASTVMALEPTIIPMPNGNISIPRITGGASANYVGENQPAQASQQTFGMVQLSAKKLVTLVPISNDMLKYPSVSVDGIVRDDMVRTIAMRADLAFLRGDGTQGGPRGLRSFAAAPSLSGANVIAASAAVNLQTITSDAGRLELALESANIGMRKPGWVMSPRTKTYLMNLRDGLGNLVYSAEMSRGMWRGKPFRITTQIPNNLAGIMPDGTTTTTDASELYLADFAEVLIGEAYGLELEVFNGGTYVDAGGALQSGISNDQTVMRAIVQHDLGMRQEAAAAVLTGVRWGATGT